MSSISAQGVVERASAELSKRINGLGLRSKHHHTTGGGGGTNKTSVMERVTNVLCGGSHHNNSAINAPEKPSRLSGKQQTQQIIGSKNSSGLSSQQSTPQLIRKSSHPHVTTNHSHQQPQLPTPILTKEQLFQDDRFLNKFFHYFNPNERRVLAQVCVKWRDYLYRSPRFWAGLVPVLQCREMKQISNQDRVKLYNSLIRRGFHGVG
jgi:F-box and leucine-rich repeat protein 16